MSCAGYVSPTQTRQVSSDFPMVFRVVADVKRSHAVSASSTWNIPPVFHEPRCLRNQAHKSKIRRWPAFTPPPSTALAAHCGLVLHRRAYLYASGNTQTPP